MEGERSGNAKSTISICVTYGNSGDHAHTIAVNATDTVQSLLLEYLKVCTCGWCEE